MKSSPYKESEADIHLKECDEVSVGMRHLTAIPKSKPTQSDVVNVSDDEVVNGEVVLTTYEMRGGKHGVTFEDDDWR